MKLGAYRLEEFDVNCGPLSVTIIDGIQKFDIQWLMNIDATAVAVVRAVSLALVSFENWPTLTKMNWFPSFLLDNRSNVFMAT